MYDKTVTDRFITLRSQGMTLAKIMQELNVSKPTLIGWSRKFRFEIQNARVIELEALRDQWLNGVSDRVNGLGEQLKKAEAELAKRDLTALSTPQLFTLASALRKRIEHETGSLQFTTPTGDMPSDEYHEEVLDWKP